jgi:uncharacterized protein YyaL (SSP411 family)
MITFKELLQRVHDAFVQRKSDIQQQNASLAKALNSVYSPSSAVSVLSSAPLDQVRNELQKQFDTQHGGFGVAPKFPHTPFIERLMRHAFSGKPGEIGDEKALAIASYTLEKMALGGINDQLGGGFCRYSVDDVWMIPHFEKMLYDNAALLAEYAQASAAIEQPLFAQIAHQTARWVMREMQSAEGAYYSSYDADSKDAAGHSHEGLFYVWTPEEARQHLSDSEYAVFARRFGLDKPANFEGKWHLHVYTSMQQLQQEFKQPEKALSALLDSARHKLLAVRKQRPWPGRDDKILTAWNALMIRGMALSARYLDEPEYEQSATQSVDFIKNTLWQDGKLLASYKDGKAHLNAYLDDYAFLLDALLELLQVRWRSEDLSFARELADSLLENFEDRQNGGFWFVAHDHEKLIQRPKSYTDDAIPGGNGVAAFALQRLGFLLGETRYLDAAERSLQNAWGGILQAPSAHCTLLKALQENLNAPQTVIIRGKEEQLSVLQSRLNQHYTPARQCYFIGENVADLPQGLQDKRVMQGKTSAYVCQGMQCLPPLLGDSIRSLG